MANKMLIDATHPEETRVVVLRGSRVEEFDFESASKRQLRGNIYLAKVIRVEPSLQAAFVDYGGNRHGFLAFSEIHPDYYQIPVSDRQALLDEEAAEPHDEDEDERRPRRSRRHRGERHAAAARRGDKDDVVRENAEQEAASEAADHAHDDEATSAGAHEHETHDHESRDEHVHGEADEASQTEMPGVSAAAKRAGAEGDELRPVKLDAEQTPPYDDPTAGLIEHAAEVHAHVADHGTSDSGPGEQPVATPAGPPATATATHEVEAAAAESTAEPAATRTDEATDATIEGGDERDAHGAEADDHSAGGRKAAESRAASGEEAEEHDEDEPVDQLGGDAMEEIPRRAYRPRRQYKIQEVIKRRQVLLVQVMKEERGNKGAALTTYLSLAGRYSVLMPNTARGGGISRKITDAGDRQRLKTIAQDLEVPDGMGVILRTAGALRSKPEVKRDFEYLMRMWETVRETTLASTAPKLVYEEGSLIKRAIRDLYNSDVDEIVVAGEDGYREAKAFMRLLTPSHVKNVQPWRDPAPLFTKAGAETQLDAMFSNHVTLKSGGYLVINQTEALVAIDVNSGRSTREHNIEDTALRTNLEAADEVARQLRLRDLAGLIVVDFIDMEETRNNRAVERRIKDALKDDRARIQIGRISHFGLLEMSRQRIRTGVLEGSTEVCQHCAGAGMVRSTSSIALHVLRLLEDALVADATRNMIVRTRGAVALYILNFKRGHLDGLEGRFGMAVTFEHDEHLTGSVYCSLERGGPATGIVRAREIPAEDPVEDGLDETTDDLAENGGDDATKDGGAIDGEDRGEPRRRRRRRGRGRDRTSSGIAEDAPQPADDALGFIDEVEGARRESSSDDASEEATDEGGATGGEDGRSRRRRSRRGGRRNRDEAVQMELPGTPEAEAGEVASVGEAAEASIGSEGELPAPRSHDHETEVAPVAAPETEAVSTSAVADAPTGDMAAAAASDEDVDKESSRAARPEPVSSELDPSRPKRSGWWQRAKASITG